MVALACAQPGSNKGSPGIADLGSLGKIDPECWESSSLQLVKMKKIKVRDPVIDLWDFMMFLKGSESRKYNAFFLDLAQLFWDMYVECVLSRSHGLGRRQILSKKYTFKYSQETAEG
ncbi:protein FAM237A-like [Latimeria chalumnae]|uniref:protein FAM237A-like n=1 Tax=Latimeria chalumnae TaxID=7897 RepID=UPI00313E9095